MIIIEDINQSFSVIKNIDIDTFNLVSPQLSVFVDGYRFMPAYKIGIWDGQKKFYKIINNNFVFPRGLAKYVLKKLKSANISAEYQETVSDYHRPTKEEFTDFVNTLGLPFPPYGYQIESAYDSIINARQISQMSTGSGKSLTIYIIIRWMLSQGYKSVVIVPTIMLTTQIYEDFKSYGMQDTESIHLIGGDNKVKHFDKAVTISTWQSLIGSPELFSDVDCLVVDECHKARSKSFEEIIFPSASSGQGFRIGMSGTLPSNLVDKLTLLGGLGPSKKYITPRQLIDMGLATPVQIKCMYFNYPQDERIGIKSLTYAQEVEYLTKHKKRTLKIAQLSNKISQDGNTIVLFDRVEHGLEMAINAVEVKFNITPTKKELQDINNPYGVYLVTGNAKSTFREAVRQLMELKEGIIMFGTSSILSTGVNIKKLKHLVLASGGKSSITINQSIGRLLRLHASKTMTTIWDIVDDLTIKKKSSTHKNYFYKHYEARLELYAEHEYEIIEKEISL